MMDGRRHSVDIPISKTLIALRRVKSLRDPSTNSMSKFSSLLDNLNWETNSNKGISQQLPNDCQEDGSHYNGLLGSKSICYHEQREEDGDGVAFHSSIDKSKLTTSKDFRSIRNTGLVNNVEGLVNRKSVQEEDHGNKPLSERECSSHRDKGLDLACILLSNTCMEDVDSCNEQIGGSLNENSVSVWKSCDVNHVKSSGIFGNVPSRVGSPCPSITEALSSHDTSSLADERVDVDRDQHGCGISCCWSSTPKLRGSNPSSDLEDHCLLTRNIAETTFSGQKRWKHVRNEIAPYSESPRSLSQKFRPKSFNELVGQNLVVRSLCNAITRGKITSFYLFHGPRGTGKTSTSRIFAAALNCFSLEEQKPCGLCRDCISFSSGRSKDIKEVDSVRINRTERLRSLVKNALVPPVSSRFKIFIIDECHLLDGETWATLLNSLENLPQHVVFVMITPDLDKLPRSAVSRSQKYHFPKIRDADIASRLEKICVEEGIDFDKVALNVIVAKSSGSLRDAEMMLDQLSLLGKRITISLAYELIGIVSDDDLLDLLDLALSSDTSNTVIRARELMRSKIDPMQLISQLANLIMDILAGKCQEGGSEARIKFCRRHTSEAEKQRLSQALRILSETEKGLRVSKSQSTWLTVALLQLTSLEPCSPDLNKDNPKLGLAHDHEEGGDFCSSSLPGGRLKHLVTTTCDDGGLNKLGMHEDTKRSLEYIWKRATELCNSKSFQKFLRRQGKLSSLYVNQGLAVAELEFHRAKYVSRAERSWKSIASSLQLILGCNVELRINLVICDPVAKFAKVRCPSFSLFSCSRRMQQKSQSATELGNDSEYFDYTSEKPIIRDRAILTSFSDCGSQISHDCCYKMEVVRTLRNSEGNLLSVGTTSSNRSLQGDTIKASGFGVDFSKEQGSNHEYQLVSIQEPGNQPDCFPRVLKLQKKLHSADNAETVYALGLTQQRRRSHSMGWVLPCANAK